MLKIVQNNETYKLFPLANGESEYIGINVLMAYPS